MGAFCEHCAERVKRSDAVHPLSRPFLRYCPKCGQQLEFAGEELVVGGLLFALLMNLYLCDELPIMGDLIGGVLVALGLTRLCRHWAIERKKRRMGAKSDKPGGTPAKTE